MTAELSRALYYETQGVPDFVVKLFILAQMRAIAARQELLTAALIGSAAKDFLSLARPLLKALRENDVAALERYEDLEPPDLTAEYERAQAALNEERTAAVLASLDAEDGAIPPNVANAPPHLAPVTPPIVAPLTDSATQGFLLGGESMPGAAPPPMRDTAVQRPRRPRRSAPRAEPSSDSLRAVVLASPGISRYDALRAANLVFALKPYLSPAT